MNETDRWEQDNEAYLSIALKWLRLRLAQHAPQDQGITHLPSGETQQPSQSFMERFWGRQPEEQHQSVAALPPPGPEADVAEEVSQAETAMTKTEATEKPPALVILSKRFGLSHFEQEVLLLCAAMEFDTRMATLCAKAQDDPNKPYPTFALALSLFDEPAWDVLSPQRPLRYWRLIEINQPGAQPLTTSALRADERIVNYIKGLNYLDDRLAPLLVKLEMAHKATTLPPSQQEVVERIVHYVEQSPKTQDPPIIQLLGADEHSKQLIAWQAARALGLHPYRLPAELLPPQTAELETLIRLWQRESILLPITLYLNAHEVDGRTSTEGQSPPLNRFLGRIHTLVFLDTREMRPDLGQATLALDIAKPTPAEQQEIWANTLGGLADTETRAQLAGQFNLNVPTIQEVAETVLADTAKEEDPLPERLWETCLANTRPRLDMLAQRLDPKATWEDIVLPEEEMNLLRHITNQVGQRSRVYDEWGFRHKMNRGLGINALFAGESGTGKTMAAEVIANELRLNLYRIDLSAVVNKYIGETEKNLRRVFDAAEDGGAILFFDECDALFGKRSEVKDSHDRYANIEINYLLQRIEAYQGLAILATNMKGALDQAFLRRLRFIVTFPFPGIKERKAIWQKVFPPETPTANLDIDRLARLTLTGGSIHNIALYAAFLATQAHTPVTMPLVLSAARSEFRKLERPINEADFRWLKASEGAA